MNAFIPPQGSSEWSSLPPLARVRVDGTHASEIISRKTTFELTKVLLIISLFSHINADIVVVY